MWEVHGLIWKLHGLIWDLDSMAFRWQHCLHSDASALVLGCVETRGENAASASLLGLEAHVSGCFSIARRSLHTQAHSWLASVWPGGVPKWKHAPCLPFLGEKTSVECASGDMMASNALWLLLLVEKVPNALGLGLGLG